MEYGIDAHHDLEVRSNGHYVGNTNTKNTETNRLDLIYNYFYANFISTGLLGFLNVNLKPHKTYRKH